MGSVREGKRGRGKELATGVARNKGTRPGPGSSCMLCVRAPSHRRVLFKQGQLSMRCAGYAVLRAPHLTNMTVGQPHARAERRAEAGPGTQAARQEGASWTRHTGSYIRGCRLDREHRQTSRGVAAPGAQAAEEGAGWAGSTGRH
eukprot:365860-Chlamydomonas_euryale.AAC.1